MNQSINLFEALPKKSKLILPTMLIVKILAGFWLLLGLIYGSAAWRQSMLDAEVSDVKQVLTLSSERLLEVVERYPKAVKDIELESDITDLESKLVAHTQLMATLAKKKGGQIRGFSPYLEALAKRSIPGVWLREFNVEAGELTLKGSAMNSSLVVEYLQSLGRDRIFRGKNFKEFKILSTEKEPLKTEEEEAAEREAQAATGIGGGGNPLSNIVSMIKNKNQENATEDELEKIVGAGLGDANEEAAENEEFAQRLAAVQGLSDAAFATLDVTETGEEEVTSTVDFVLSTKKGKLSADELDDLEAATEEQGELLGQASDEVEADELAEDEEEPEQIDNTAEEP